ncbi:helix-turn-helix transcriptional regulator [Limosilactobacillus sp. STM2_1]|uniref:Helix-turn-helix transcriptional regulator n=1 Tax=Limosilactobacillus rudii TaxID=2759755 RepID=A0A7W3YMH4_9LACO|nr:helix-turn-helix transcriptional regulator [Limosilactobacillus rudii]MBB1078440.1 helix-turn-helix transcriptional regulator [Limosilactobacillus rudii]MBB1096570.1 helix-turn-helix transcriptional regulator [Limosilactobacillus rudii]MCD7134234.1 helix-turn-helix domain-containing protein [Limosilactobacillus rudii]
MSFGKQILAQRKKLGFTQQNVADKLHITRQTLSKWENDKSYPDLKLLLALSDLYHVPVDSLLRENEDLTNYLNRNKASQSFNIIRGLFWLLMGFYFDTSINYWSNILIPIIILVIMEYLAFKESFFLGNHWTKQKTYTIWGYLWTTVMIAEIIYFIINKQLNILILCSTLAVYYFSHQYVYKLRN